MKRKRRTVRIILKTHLKILMMIMVMKVKTMIKLIYKIVINWKLTNYSISSIMVNISILILKKINLQIKILA